MNRVYCCFDANTEGDMPVDNDIKYYNLMKAWNSNDKIDFSFVNVHEDFKIPKQYLEQDNERIIKGYLEKRLNITDILAVIVGEHTANLYKYVRWELEQAINKNIPIIAINVSNKDGVDVNFCPPIIKTELVLHIPFNLEDIKTAIRIWPDNFRTLKINGEQGVRILKRKSS